MGMASVSSRGGRNVWTSRAPALLVLAVACACTFGTPAPTGRTQPPAPQDEFGVVIGEVGARVGLVLRGEEDPSTLFTFVSGRHTAFAVSPEGTRVAYAADERELRLVDLAMAGRPSVQLLTLTDERLLGFAWSTDGTGLAIGTLGGALLSTPPAPVTRLLTYDLTSKAVHEVRKLSSAEAGVPALWDRVTKTIVAYAQGQRGVAALMWILESGEITRLERVTGVLVDARGASGLVWGGDAVRVFDAKGMGAPMRPADGEGVANARIRTGTSEAFVLTGSATGPYRLELWTVQGRRVLASNVNSGWTPRVDGAAVLLGRPSSGAYGIDLLDLASGALRTLPGETFGDPLGSVRLRAAR